MDVFFAYAALKDKGAFMEFSTPKDGQGLPVTAPGQVTLVGAGPGDPEMLTFKAARAIANATLLLVDDLVHADVLNHASPQARIIRVGKRGGRASTAQGFIDNLMVMAAREGETVVRLKGGDPFIFGRGGEEAAFLRAKGIPVQLINGVSAGLAAAGALGVSLTHREYAHGVVFVTGHAKPGAVEVDWPALASAAQQLALTLVIYMGVGNAARIQSGLRQGLPDETPLAIVQNASLPGQRHALSTLGRLLFTLENEQLASPAIIVVGDVLRGIASLDANEPAQLLRTA